MLTELERQRLRNRESVEVIERKRNEFAIRKKMEILPQYLSDIELILEKLPENQIEKLIDDDLAYKIFSITELLIKILEFVPIEKTNETNIAIKGSNFVIASPDEIAKNTKLKKHIAKLQEFTDALIDPRVPDYAKKISQLMKSEESQII